MNSSDYFFTCQGKQINLKVLIAPKASRNAIIGIHNGRLKIALTAAPVDGKANQALIKFLSKSLACSKSCISLVKGHSSKAKSIQIETENIKSIANRLDEFASGMILC